MSDFGDYNSDETIKTGVWQKYSQKVGGGL